MRLRQDIHFAGNRTNGAVIPPVDTRLTCQDTTANDLLFKALEDVLDVILRRTILSRQLGEDLVLNLSHTLVARGFLGNAVCLTQRARGGGFDRCHQFGVGFRRLPVPTGLTRFADQLVDRIDHRLHFLMRIQHRTQHLIFGQLFGF